VLADGAFIFGGFVATLIVGIWIGVWLQGGCDCEEE
jgi:hypothetical protein